uniref:hypothetical protein n=1 Tax=Bacillus amyloliquefaciens TaxID=1390 RepID=UPI001E4EB5D0|nr:hypothetical protein [Bacillus amyloliquefaciens]
MPPSPRDAGPDHLRCPGRLTGLPDLATLLLIQFFAVGAAIAEMQAPIAPVALDPTGLPETDALLQLQFFAAGASIAQGFS